MGASDAPMCPLIHFATRQNALNGGPTLIVGAWPRCSSPDPMHNLPPGHRRLSPSSSRAPPAVLWIDPDGLTAIHHAEGIPVIRDWARTRSTREDAWRATASRRGPGTGYRGQPAAGGRRCRRCRPYDGGEDQGGRVDGEGALLGEVRE